MKVVCVTNLFPDSTRPGFASFNRQQLVYLSDIHDVYVICPVAWPRILSLAVKGLRPEPPEGCTGLKVVYPAYYYTPKMLRDQYWRFYYMSVMKTFRQVVNDFKPDLVYATWAYPDCRAAARLAEKAGLPLVSRVHGSDINDYFRHTGRKRLILEGMRRSDAVISVNENLASILRSAGVAPEKIHVVYNGINRDIFGPSDRAAARKELGLDPDFRMILFAGNLKPVKGIDLLVKAFSGLEDTRIHLHILGTGPEWAQLKAIAQVERVSDRVFFHGNIRHDDMSIWYNAADLFCLPSLNEGTPNVILEALACGLPVVASDTGGIPEMITPESGALFECGDSLSLQKMLGESFATDWDREKIDCPAGTWENNARKLSDVLEQVYHSFRTGMDGTRHARS